MNNEQLKGAMFSSDRQDWGTPYAFMDFLQSRFGWTPTLDASASKLNHKAPKYYTIEDNGLIQPWGTERVWLNPPFGRELPLWLEKCRATKAAWPKGPMESIDEPSIFCLIPARPDTKWFHDIVVPSASIIYFIRGRFNFDLKYERKGGNAPFPSMLIVWKRHKNTLFNVEMTTLDVPKEWRGYDEI